MKAALYVFIITLEVRFDIGTFTCIATGQEVFADHNERDGTETS